MDSKNSISTKKSKSNQIFFDDDGEILSEELFHKKNKSQKKHKKKFNQNSMKTEHGDDAQAQSQGDNEDFIKFSNDNKKNHKLQEEDEDELGKKWFESYAKFNQSAEELVELKDAEFTELKELCRKSFHNLLPQFQKRNPSDAKWLGTALHSGTSKDKANAGALLISTNPLGNLTALETLISFTKQSNKASPEACTIVTELFMDRLLPSNRKLTPLTLRGADWKTLKKDSSIDALEKNHIFAYWHFENELKQQYFEFLNILQSSIQSGQDTNKNSSIICAANLLSYGPEKEQMLLSMLINKLGDPSNKVSAKSLHHLTEVAYKHPNMVGVMTMETEKLLFRNNISEHAQHFALCFLAQVAPRGNPEVCTKLVNICFSLFNVLVKRGAVNNKTMQAILRCLQKAIIEAKPSANNNNEIMTKEMQDTIYRLVHLADIHVAVQTLSLLLQLITIETEKSDRFYNALYRKLTDLNLTTIGNKTAAQLLHIVHRAIHIDTKVNRARAFIKRLLQITTYMPSQIICGCLIVVSKLLKNRKDLRDSDIITEEQQPQIMGVMLTTEDQLKKFDSDDEEKYEDVESDDDKKSKKNQNIDEFKGSSWHHLKISNKSEFHENMDVKDERKISDVNATKYDPYHRVPAYAGAEYSLRSELILLKYHYHPTVQVFAENIIEHKKIDYYGDPLKDFGLTHFLERFAFKNPKKLNAKDVDLEKSVTQQLHHKKYLSYGARGRNVKALTNQNCSIEERFIFKYLEKKREIQVIKHKDNSGADEDVDDDEFEAYINELGKKAKKDAVLDDVDDDMDYMKELGVDLKDEDNKKMKKKKKSKKDMMDSEDDDNDIDNDWGDDDMDEGSDNEISADFGNGEFDGSDDEGSISLDDDDEDDDDDDDDDDELSEGFNEDGDDDDDDDEPKAKKSKQMSSKSFNRALNQKSNMNSLFAAADDFAELLEETGKLKGHGTSKALFNQDKSSDKQMKWEEKRRSDNKYHKNTKTFHKNKKFNRKS